MFVDLGAYLRQTLLYGIAFESRVVASEAELARELIEARDLLGRLPRWAFTGRADANVLVLNGVEP